MKNGKKKILIICIIAVVIAALAVTGILIYTNGQSKKIKSIEEEIFKLPSKSFDADELDDLKKQLEDWSSMSLSDSAMGVLYGRLAYIASQKGDWNSYYTNYGKEQYYLEESGDYDDEINGLCDIFFYTYLASGRIDKAKETLKRIDEIISEHGLNNQQFASIVNRHHSAIAYYDNDFDAAIEYADKARTVLEDKSPNYYDTYIMGADMLEAKALCGKGKFDEAEKLLERHKDSGLFNSEFYPSTLNNVCLIPYYQTLAYVSAAQSDEYEMLKSVKEVVSRSIKYDYEQYGFDTLGRIEEFGPFSEDIEVKLTELKKELNDSFESLKEERLSDMCDEIMATGYEAAKGGKR